MPMLPKLLFYLCLTCVLAACDRKPSASKVQATGTSSAAASKVCEAGREWQGGACLDIDECGGVATPCGPHPQAKCRNTDGAYECTCPEGFVGGGPGGFGCAPSVARIFPRYTCAIAQAGTVECWNVQDGKHPKPETPAHLRSLRGVVALSEGNFTGCALLRDGTVHCWGGNDKGQLGDGTRADRALPAAVPGVQGAVSIVMSGPGACALLRDGTVSCWGHNEYGALGRATQGGIEGPGSVHELRDAVSVARDGYRSCGLLRNGQVHCWGSGALGNIGTDTSEDRPLPVRVPGIEDAIAIAVDSTHACFLRRDRTLWCWGRNLFGALGNGTQIESATPVQAKLDQVDWVEVASDKTRALRAGQLYRWGHVYHPDQDRQGFDSEKEASLLLPTAVAGFAGVRAFEPAFMCARFAGRAIVCGDDGVDYTVQPSQP